MPDLMTSWTARIQTIDMQLDTQIGLAIQHAARIYIDANNAMTIEVQAIGTDMFFPDMGIDPA